MVIQILKDSVPAKHALKMEKMGKCKDASWDRRMLRIIAETINEDNNQEFETEEITPILLLTM